MQQLHPTGVVPGGALIATRLAAAMLAHRILAVAVEIVGRVGGTMGSIYAGDTWVEW